MSSIIEDAPVPRIEGLLKAAFSDLALLQKRREALVNCGVSGDNLPNDDDLMAFALLGEHDRAPLMERMRLHWPMLLSKGMVRGSLSDAPTPELRFLTHSLEWIDALDDVWQRLQSMSELQEPPQGMMRCAKRIRGFWGQPARLRFVARDVAYILVSPDPLFGLQSAFLAADDSGRYAGEFIFPVDNGNITFTLQHCSGDVYRYTVRSSVEGT